MTSFKVYLFIEEVFALAWRKGLRLFWSLKSLLEKYKKETDHAAGI